jgi:hypothetical protein
MSSWFQVVILCENYLSRVIFLYNHIRLRFIEFARKHFPKRLNAIYDVQCFNIFAQEVENYL